MMVKQVILRDDEKPGVQYSFTAAALIEVLKDMHPDAPIESVGIGDVWSVQYGDKTSEDEPVVLRAAQKPPLKETSK